eukprot:2052228-Pleurochrysis_carterae.AAC.1
MSAAAGARAGQETMRKGSQASGRGVARRIVKKAPVAKDNNMKALHIKPRIIEVAKGTLKCEWTEVRSGTTAGKGDGIFAVVPLPAGSRLDYYGAILTQDEWENEEDQQYCVGIHGSHAKFIDGHPSWHSRWQPMQRAFLPKKLQGAMKLPPQVLIGGLVNEPSPGEQPNAKLVGTSRTAYIEMTRDVAAGSEIITLYGEEYIREYPSPYDWLPCPH